MSDTLRLTGIGDLLSAVPYLLGYQPDRDITVICLQHIESGNPRVGMIARIDLPDPGEAHLVAEQLLPALLRQAPAGIVIAGFDAEPGESAVAVEVVSDLLALNGLYVVDAVTAIGDRWRPLHPGSTCPPQGWPITSTDSAAVAELIGQGSAPAESRTALADRISPDGRSEKVGQQCKRLFDNSEVTAQEALAAWVEVASNKTALTDLADETLATAAIGLHAGGTADVRDAVLSWLSPALISSDLARSNYLNLLEKRMSAARVTPSTTEEDRRAVLHRLMALCASLPDEYAVATLSVLGYYAWSLGDGTIALIAVERALTACPTYSLARLLDLALTQGMQPPRH